MRHPQTNHHSATIEWLGEGNPYKDDIEALPEEGGAFSSGLAGEILSIKEIPIDGSVAEGPHAQANRPGMFCRAALFAWLSATMRLSQHLDDWDRPVHLLRVNPQHLWTHMNQCSQDITNSSEPGTGYYSQSMAQGGVP